MKKEYDFSNAEQGKFTRKIQDINIPIYLDKDVRLFFLKTLKLSEKDKSLSEIVNDMLKKDIAITKKFLA